MNMSQYIEIFIEETKEHLQSLNQSLLLLEKNSEDKSIINEIFRAAHTLKGMSGTMGFNKMSILTHDMENVLHALRSGEININTELIDLLFKCLDALEKYLNNIVETGNEGADEYKDIIELLSSTIGNEPDSTDKNLKTANILHIQTNRSKIVDIIKHPTSNLKINQYEQNVINKAIEQSMNAFQITIVLNKGCLLKSARAFIIFQALERGSEIIKAEPGVQDIEDEKFEYEFTVVVVTRESEDYFEKSLMSISEVEEVIIAPLSSKPIVDENLMENIKKDIIIDNWVEHDSGEIVETASIDKAAAGIKASDSIKKTKMGKTVRVEISRLDVLLNLVSELIIQKTRLEGLEEIERTQTYVEAVEYLERITTSLHDAVMKARMVPVETVFNRFPRMLRDISKENGKEVNLKMSGEETELDRTVIDEIGEPLIHLLRNAVDHGIEPVGKRKELGKHETGSIYLRAYQDGTNVVIEVEDDGQGIDLDRVKRKALEKGLINKEYMNSLSKKDIIDFLFRPNFSTSYMVTDLSGRGVGLDVVKMKIESLGGIVEVETEAGEGTRFIIRLPLTLAIIQALLVQVGSEKYAIQLSSIKQIIKISPADIKLIQKQEVILLRNAVIPIIRLDRVLGIKKEDIEEKQLTIVIVKKGDRMSGFIVDKILGQQEIVQKSLGKFLSGIKTITSATILGDGNVALILDVNTLAI